MPGIRPNWVGVSQWMVRKGPPGAALPLDRQATKSGTGLAWFFQPVPEWT
jgi:hypothetical protein